MVERLIFTEELVAAARLRDQDGRAHHRRARADAPRPTAEAPDNGRWAFQTLFALRFGIAGGTTEIQKGIIGERLLGLPK